MVGIGDRHHGDPVPVRKGPHSFKRNELIGCSLCYAHAVCIGAEIPDSDIIVLQRLHKCGGEHDLAVKAGRHFASCGEGPQVLLRQDCLCQHPVHDNGGTPQADPAERICAVVGDVFEHKVAAETGRAGIEDLGTKGLPDIVQNGSQVGVAVPESDPGVLVVPVSGPVENDKGSVIVFFQDPGGKLVGHGIVLVTGKTVAEDDDMSE